MASTSGHEIDAQDIFVNSLTVAACGLPILVFPFLPNRVPINPLTKIPPSSSQRTLGPIYCVFYAALCGVLIFWLTRLLLVAVLFPDQIHADSLYPSNLVIYLTFVSLALSFPPLLKWNIGNLAGTRVAHREPERSDFTWGVGLALGPPWMEFAQRFIAPHFGPWYNDYFVDAYVVGIGAGLMGYRLTEFVCRVVKRDIGWWTWLENRTLQEKKDDVFVKDDPWWSWSVYRLLVVGVPLLWLTALIRVLTLASSS